jgi:hypothetical protein
VTDTIFEPAPDYAEPLEGWRVWRVVDERGRLSLGSVIKSTVWPAGDPLVAECLRRHPFGWWPWRRTQHDAPEARCECGIYATTLERVGQYLCEPLPQDAVARILGRVALWGTVVECERGLRASHAYPIKLYVPSDASRERDLSAEELARQLGDYNASVEVLAARSRDAPLALGATPISGVI